MHSSLFQDFDERSKEVSRYFFLLKNLEADYIKLAMRDRDGNPRIRDVNPELLKTLKAGSFLLLYNLVESTMNAAIEAIFDELESQQVSFDSIRPELKKIVLKNFRMRKTDTVIAAISDISTDIISASFKRNELFSGNLDGKKIRETATAYGFSYQTDHTKTGGGQDLLIIKTNRNDLAHGFKSFADVGRDKTANELLEIKGKTIRYLRQILSNVEDYLRSQEYLDSALSSPP